MERDDLAGLAASLFAEGRTLRLVARGRSMAPFIRDGETVLIGPSRRSPRPGEVVLRRGPGGTLLLHRVVRATAAGVVTRGDASAAEDPPAPLSDVLGRAVAVAGRRRLHLRSACGRLVLLGHRLRGGRLADGPLLRLTRGLRLLAARFP